MPVWEHLKETRGGRELLDLDEVSTKFIRKTPDRYNFQDTWKAAKVEEISGTIGHLITITVTSQGICFNKGGQLTAGPSTAGP